MRNTFYSQVLFCLLFSASLLPNAMAMQVPIIDVDTTDKSAFDIGKTLGRAVKKQFPNIEHHYDAYLANSVSQEKFSRWLEQRVNVIKARLDQDYVEEALGMTSVWQISSHDQLGDGDLSINEYWFFQLLPDIGVPIGGSGFGVWSDASYSGYPIVGRNLDWAADESLRSLQAITIYRDQSHGLVNIGFAGFIGVISGFNQAGLFLAHLDSPMLSKSHSADYSADSVVFDIRKALESERSISGAIGEFDDSLYTASHSILLADNYNVQVLEQPPGQQPEVRRDRSDYRANKAWNKKYQIAVVNCFVLASSPDNCFNTRDNFRWDRFRELAVFQGRDQAKPANVIDVMFDHLHQNQAIYNRRTMQSMVFEPESRNLHFYAMPISGVHESKPRMQQLSGLLSDIPDDAFDWLSTLNIAIFLALTVLVAAILYGEFAKKKE